MMQSRGRHGHPQDEPGADELLGAPLHKKESPFRQVTDRVAGAIISGEYRAGDLVPNEDGLKGDITVSRTAYREAIKYLSAKGLIEARPKSGTRVAPPSSWNLLDPDVLRWSLEMQPNAAFIGELFELRRFIEPNATRFAAERRTVPQLAAIEAAMLDMEALPVFSEASIRADVRFHEAIFDATENRALMCLKPVVSCTLQWSMKLRSDEANFRVALLDHRRVFQAIEQSDGERAYALSTVLVMQACDDTLRALEQRQQHQPKQVVAE
jgi:GntR family transcriptional regulator, galactonate operon transcriptional repressor